ncbi:MAG: DUF4118 domain-containing protein [Acidobacteriota bacterium]|nr:DUF4118 domain-containing protein [Acidobacteriota bacterium]
MKRGPRTTVCVLFVPAIVLFYRYVVHANATTVALTFLLAVLLISANWGFWYAVPVALLSTVAFNFFFLPPIGTFTISDPQNWASLFAFVATAIIAGELSERARRQALAANQRRKEIERLYAFSQHLLTLESIPELLNLLPGHIVKSFGAKGAAIFVSERTDIYRSTSETRELETERLRSVAARGEPVSDSEKQVAFAPLRVGVRSVGAIGISGTILSSESLDALATLVALAIERTRAIENVGKAEVARESEKLRSAILDSVAHDFRTPLTSIKACATSLLSGGLDDTQRNELLTVINEESDRLNHLVEEAMQLSRLESNQVELDRKQHTIREAIDRAMETAGRIVSEHPIKLDLANDLPEFDYDLGLIASVVLQLLENAAKYSPPNSPIRVSVEKSGSQITVSVADRGPGIDDFEQTLIFDKFYRGKNSRYLVQGTGMGLAIAKAVVETHGGSIRVTSQLEHGSVFSFNLPLNDTNNTRSA